MGQTTVRLDPHVVEAVERLRSELDATFGNKPSRQELVNALGFGATALDAYGMLLAYKRDAARRRSEAEEPTGE